MIKTAIANTTIAVLTALFMFLFIIDIPSVVKRRNAPPRE